MFHHAGQPDNRDKLHSSMRPRFSIKHSVVHCGFEGIELLLAIHCELVSVIWVVDGD